MWRYRVVGAVSILLVLGMLAAASAWTRSATAERRAFLADYLAADFDGRIAVVQKYLKTLPPHDLVGALQERDPLCHTDAHPLGRAIFKETQSLTQSLRVCGSTCSYGCFHGVLMETFSTRSDTFGGAVDEDTSGTALLERLVERAPDFCSQKAVREFIVPWACIHGLGHVIMYMSKYDSQQAVAACAKFEDPTKSGICAGGAFMELIHDGAHQAAVTKKDYFPCDLFPQYAKSCFRYKGGKMVDAWGSAERAINACRALSPRYSRLACIRGVGVSQGAPLERFSKPDGFDDLCGSLEPDERAACIEGAVSNVVFKMDADSSAACDAMAPVFQSQCRSMFYEFKNLK